MKRALLVLVVNVVIFLVLAEVVALGAFYYQHGWLFYLDPYRPTIALLPDAAGGSLTSIGLHPYFGPTHRKGIPFDLPPGLEGAGGENLATNNFGFPSRHDYPFVKDNDRQFIIGIFGGSVGEYFCRIGAPRLEDDLRRTAQFRDRDIVTLCFSHEGYKQPQQLLVLAYFLSIGQPFDMAVNIDGFNEVSLGAINDQYGWDISMPSHEHLGPLINLVDQATLTPAKLDALYRIAHDRARLNDIAGRTNRAWFASAEFVLRHYYQFVQRRYQRELVAFDQLPAKAEGASLVQVTPKVRPRSGEVVFADIAAEWSAASLTMQQLLAARHVPYIHVLQPNQYYSTRAFGDAERKTAFNDASPFKAGAARGYPFLEKALEPGALNGVHIFDAEPSPVYMDDCCHYTIQGNHLLADFVAREIASVPGHRGTETQR